MCKLKASVLAVLFLLAISTVSEARVCFLKINGDDARLADLSYCIGAGAEDYIKLTNCPNYETCSAPEKGAKSCKEGGLNLYLPEDCCTNTTYYEECLASEGKVCKGNVCNGRDAQGHDYVSCEVGQCKCSDEYNKVCSASDGLLGVGIACDGKYKECVCDKNKFYACGDNAVGTGASCSDSTGTYYSACMCENPDGFDWVSDPDDCCVGVKDACENKPSNIFVYECRSWTPPSDCVCGYTYMAGKTGCIDGCNDSEFNYIGNSTNVTCVGNTIRNLAEDGICGNNCSCSTGFWDYNDTCSDQEEDFCYKLGYTEYSCEGDWIACPFDASAKKCIDFVPSCEFKTQNECENANSNSVCTKSTLGCWEVTGCNNGYTLSDGQCIEADCSAYPLTSCPVGATSCSGCLSGTTTKYKADGCEEGYTLTDGDCSIATCDGYPLASCPANGICSECLSGTTTKYKITGCNSGYVLVDGECYKTHTSCEDAGFSAFAENCSSNGYETIVLDDGTSKTCCSDFCEGVRITACSEEFVKSCTSYNGVGYGTCCTYASSTTCESVYKNSVCTENTSGCYQPSNCTDGFVKSCSSSQNLVDVDAYGCGVCEDKCPTGYYETLTECNSTKWQCNSDKTNSGQCVLDDESQCYRVKTCSEQGYMDPDVLTIKNYLSTLSTHVAGFGTGVYPGYVRCITPSNNVTFPTCFFHECTYYPCEDRDDTVAFFYRSSDCTSFSDSYNGGSAPEVAIEFGYVSGAVGGYRTAVVGGADLEDNVGIESLQYNPVLYDPQVYYPTVDELNLIKDNFNSINSLLTRLGKTPLSDLDCYWGYDYKNKQFYKLAKVDGEMTVYKADSGKCKYRPIYSYNVGYHSGGRLYSTGNFYR